MNTVRTLINQSVQQGESPLQACCNAVQTVYPELQLRWARIYGYRWAFLWGETGEISSQPVRIQLNHDYGLCIDNPAMLNAEDFEELINTLKECCPDEHTLS